MVIHPIESEGRCRKSKRLAIPPRRLFMAPLMAAVVLGVSQPAANAEWDPPGPDTFCASDAPPISLCCSVSCGDPIAFQLSQFGQFRFMPDGEFVAGSESGRLTGVIDNGDQFSPPTMRFGVAIDMSGRVAPPPFPIQLGHSLCYDVASQRDPSFWTAFTELTGELVGLPGSQFDIEGARYAITRKSDVQFGLAANNTNINLGLYAEIFSELVNPAEHPTLPTGPFAGVVTIDLEPAVAEFVAKPLCFPPAEPDLTGTWTGTLDCAGFDAEARSSAKPIEEFFSAAVLQIGRTNELDAGDQYSVRLTREAGNARSFCAFAPNNPGSTTGGQGVLVEPSRQQARVYFKFEGEMLKARELIADGLHGTQLCKWSFTRTNQAAPVVIDYCSPLACINFGAIDRCDDNALCGRGPFPEGGITFVCTCNDGFVGGGSPLVGGCTPAP